MLRIELQWFVSSSFQEFYMGIKNIVYALYKRKKSPHRSTKIQELHQSGIALTMYNNNNCDDILAPFKRECDVIIFLLTQTH